MGIKALLVYPEMPPTYWSMRYTLPFLGRKAVFPPLGLLTVAAMLPSDWELRLLDLNVEPISRSDLEDADLVLASAMLVQRPSFERVAALCRESHTPLVAGGPFPTSCHEEIQGVDHFVLGEAEVNLAPFLEDWRNGCPKPCYQDPGHPDITRIPPPRFDLVNRRNYVGAAPPSPSRISAGPPSAFSSRPQYRHVPRAVPSGEASPNLHPPGPLSLAW